MVIKVSEFEVSLPRVVDIFCEHMLRWLTLAIRFIFFWCVEGLNGAILVNKEFLKHQTFRLLQLILYILIIISGIEISFNLNEHWLSRLSMDLLTHVLRKLCLLSAICEGSGECRLVKSDNLLVGAVYVQVDGFYHIESYLEHSGLHTLVEEWNWLCDCYSILIFVTNEHTDTIKIMIFDSV